MFDRLGSLLKVFDDGRALVVGATKPDTEDNKPFVVLCGLIVLILVTTYVIFLEQAAG